MIRSFLLLILLSTLLNLTWAFPAPPNNQKVLPCSKDTLCYTEKYYVLASDSKTKHGSYALYLKEYAIEQGQYTNGKRTGIWKFYTIENEVELMYDYDNNKPLKILPHIGHKYSEDTYPAIFLGSPLHIRHYICTKTSYPAKERGEFQNCQIDVALHINSKGEFTGYHIKRFSKEDFNNSVINAMKKIPKDWRWLPARQNGKNIDSEYIISIVFEYVK